MHHFSFKKIGKDESNFGNLLQESRKAKNLDLTTVSKTLGISEKYLQALESNRFDLLPSGIYKKNFIKKYSEYLGIDKNVFNNKIEEAYREDNDDPFAGKIIDKKKLIVFPRIFRNAFFILAVIACFLYLSFYVRKIVSPPELTIYTPENNLLIEEKTIEVRGETDIEAEIRINGELVLADREGNFSATINLRNGLNTITISSKKKYSKENIEIRQILVE